MLDTEKIREDFPILSRKVRRKPLAYLDNAATTQKPNAVIDAIAQYYRSSNANPHRGTSSLSQEATEIYEGARKKVAAFVGAKPQEIIFTRNATESLNLAAHMAGEVTRGVRRGRDGILLTQMEHHSNIVPWQLLAKRRGRKLKFVKVRSYGALCNEDVSGMLGGCSIFSFTHLSNVLGTVNDAKALCSKAAKAGALSVVDGAQSVPHLEVNVKEIDCDFLAFSGHKMLGPTGIGVLYARKELQEKSEPFLGGGDMIRQVGFERSTWNDAPYKFEAGTPNVAGAVGLAAAIDYLKNVGMGNIEEHEAGLGKRCVQELEGIGGMRVLGPKKNRTGIVAFNIGKLHAHDVGEFADEDGIVIRTGHHCAQPLMAVLGETASCRASFYLYNTSEEVERLAASMRRAAKALK
jgi:cysteine desulfurase/selenocysteine lyase